MEIIQDFIPKGRKNRPGKLNPCNYVTIHNTGNSSVGANAANHAKYLKGDAANDAPVSWHYTCDKGGCYQHLPDIETAFHAGDGSGKGNTESIGIEICDNSDGNIMIATINAGILTAMLCNKYNIPITNIVQHNRWSGKNCPQQLRAGNPFSWETFVMNVKDAMTIVSEHWAEKFYKYLVKEKIFVGDSTSEIWKNYDASLSTITVGQFLAVIAKVEGFRGI